MSRSDFAGKERLLLVRGMGGNLISPRGSPLFTLIAFE